MAVVVKCKSDYINEVAESAKAKSSIPERKIHSKSKKRKTEAKGIEDYFHRSGETEFFVNLHTRNGNKLVTIMKISKRENNTIYMSL